VVSAEPQSSVKGKGTSLVGRGSSQNVHQISRQTGKKTISNAAKKVWGKGDEERENRGAKIKRL